MNPCPAPIGPLSDLLSSRREDIARRWEERAGASRGEGLLRLPTQTTGSLEWVDSVVDLLRLFGVSAEHEVQLPTDGQGAERYRAGANIAAVVREYGLLRDVLVEVLEESGWPPDFKGLRALNRAIDASIADAVTRHAAAHEQTLRLTEAKLHDILDHAPPAIYAKDATGRYLFVNRAFERGSGLISEKVVGHTDDELFTPEAAAEFSSNDRRVLESGQPLESDEHVRFKDGWHIYQSLKFPLLGVGGQAHAVCGISTDVTEVRRIQRERDEARERLRRVITELPVVLWATDPVGNITLFEGAGLRAMGVRTEDVVGRNTSEVYASRPELLDAARRAQEGETFSLELEVGGAWFMAFISPELGPDGRVMSVSGVSLDITERRRAEEVLRQSETRYRLATLATRDVIYDWNLSTGHIQWSELANRQFRLPPEMPGLDIEGWTRSIHPEDRERVGRDMQRIIDMGLDHWRDEYRFRRGDGSWAIIEDRGQVVRDAAGRALRMVGAMHDVTERRVADEEARRRAEFEQLLIGIVSHDLRNPLSAITMASTTLLRRESLDERQRKVIDRILSSAERATRMLRDVLDFTQARLGGGIPMQPRPQDLHELTRQVLDEVRLAHPERVLELESRGDGAGAWDPDRLAQVITNLVNNALAYSPSHCPVLVRTHGTRDALMLSVHNMGTPIPPELLPRLFEPMKRAERLESQDGRGGLGLGLFIVKHIVDAHGGRLRVRSSQQGGTLFMVRLPRAPTPQTPMNPGP
ncbi:PAS domain-containing protein [Myxococcus sp. CA051A]|uniref:PAS domain-containing protein n=1 Tax=unclassified Myxococcus TaxID=2648731 RepID=UPI00157A6562|nr:MULTISPECIES: PAS domain-containing protein [unclassified Myxococcus]NTX09916.1 PAS domain-containing protein [Myxococcus sp. CA056]NTX64378.1 PAS domain-containing protein [Myxococcus sp. CA051A]